MKILIQYFPGDSEEVLYNASALSFERAEMELETLRKVVAKDEEAAASALEDETI